MRLRVRVLLVSAALVAAFGPLAAVQAAPTPQPDDATVAAIAKWRTATLAVVSPAFRDIVAATYNNQPLVADSSQINDAMILKAQAEQVAWSTLDSASLALIEDYYSAGTEAANNDQ